MRLRARNHVWRLTALFAGVVLTLGSTIAQEGSSLPVQVAAASPSVPDLEAGIESYWSGDYPDTVATLTATCPGLDEDEAIECFKYLGFGQVALGDSDGAQKSFLALLARDGAYVLDSSEVSPKILAEFDLAKKAHSVSSFDAAKQAYFDKKYEQAAAMFDQVLVLNPEHLPSIEYRDMARERLSLMEKEAELAKAPPVAPAPPVEAPPDPNRIYRMTSQIQAPVLSRQVRPVYPEAAMRARREGTVILSLVVTRDGTVDELKIIRGVSARIDECDTKTGACDASRAS